MPEPVHMLSGALPSFAAITGPLPEQFLFAGPIEWAYTDSHGNEIAGSVLPDEVTAGGEHRWSQLTFAQAIGSVPTGAVLRMPPEPLTIQTIEHERARSQSYLICGGRVDYDPRTSQIRIDAERTQLLSRLESRLLAALVENAEMPLNREDLLRIVWEKKIREIIDPRTVDVHISRLRGKLGKMGKHIETVKPDDECEQGGYRYTGDPTPKRDPRFGALSGHEGPVRRIALMRVVAGSSRPV